MDAETIEVPMTTLPDGRQFISAQDAIECPAVGNFVARLSNYWIHDFHLDGWVSPPKETPDE